MRISRLLAISAVSLSFAAAAQADIVYGISNGFGFEADNRIYEINPANADLTNIQQVTLANHIVRRSLSLAANPIDNSLWAILQTDDATGASGRRLVTINPSTGVSTLVGTLSTGFSYLAFRSNGTLYAVTGDGANPSETLFTLSTFDASETLQFPLGNGADGEVIAFAPNGLLYHSSGNGSALFESVNVDTQVVTPIGQATGEMFAMGFHPTLNSMFGSDIASGLYTIDLATGARTAVGDMSDQLGSADNRGFAVVVPEPGTLTLLSLAGLAVLRRRRK